MLKDFLLNLMINGFPQIKLKLLRIYYRIKLMTIVILLRLIKINSKYMENIWRIISIMSINNLKRDKIMNQKSIIFN